MVRLASLACTCVDDENVLRESLAGYSNCDHDKDFVYSHSYTDTLAPVPMSRSTLRIYLLQQYLCFVHTGFVLDGKKMLMNT